VVDLQAGTQTGTRDSPTNRGVAIQGRNAGAAARQTANLIALDLDKGAAAVARQIADSQAGPFGACAAAFSRSCALRSEALTRTEKNWCGAFKLTRGSRCGAFNYPDEASLGAIHGETLKSESTAAGAFWTPLLSTWPRSLPAGWESSSDFTTGWSDGRRPDTDSVVALE